MLLATSWTRIWSPRSLATWHAKYIRIMPSTSSAPFMNPRSWVKWRPMTRLAMSSRPYVTAVAESRGTTAEALESEQKAKIASGVLPPRGVAMEARVTRRNNAWLAASDWLVRQGLAGIVRHVIDSHLIPRLIGITNSTACI